jgi:hypothetical protein
VPNTPATDAFAELSSAIDSLIERRNTLARQVVRENLDLIDPLDVAEFVSGLGDDARIEPMGPVAPQQATPEVTAGIVKDFGDALDAEARKRLLIAKGALAIVKVAAGAML